MQVDGNYSDEQSEVSETLEIIEEVATTGIIRGSASRQVSSGVQSTVRTGGVTSSSTTQQVSGFSSS